MFNADDFAVDRGCSSAIITALGKGRLQGTSILAGGEDQSSYETLAKTGCKFINVHLNLLEGRSFVEGGSEFGLTSEDGFFCLSLGQLIKTLYFSSKKKLLREWIFKEFCQQIEFVHSRFSDRQIRFDGHLHIHILPPLRPVIEELFKKYPVSYIRNPLELGYKRRANIIDNIKGNLRRQLLGFWAKDIRMLAHRYQVLTSDFFVGATASCNLALDDIEKGLELISSKTAGRDATVEIMTHPVNNEVSETDFYKDSQYRLAHMTTERHQELELLLSDDLLKIMRKYDAVFVE
ncbi:ChbG/HpnK family deacetylase [uncultured Bartonella sp.]|uniref:ChbG/HpnK family deacetylase n=1 Tax=uncultured Bartonella sp. TaxID=104108 RepID=UPI0025CE37AE|nr:ChbG/HpnK family deacetylase [uncultured Bartonella sp.]